MTEGDLERIHRTAEKANINPADFGRQAIERAIQEKEEDAKLIRKTKR